VHVALLVFSDKLRQLHVSVSLHTQKPTEKNNGKQLHKATDGEIWYFYSMSVAFLLIV
jgi:mannosyltransferase OCH1-like enzyme